MTEEEFVHEIVERGNVESASNVEIRCEVKMRGKSITILEIVPEGTYVEPGQVSGEARFLESRKRVDSAGNHMRQQ